MSTSDKDRLAKILKDGVPLLYPPEQNSKQNSKALPTRNVNGRRVDAMVRVIPKKKSLYTQLWQVDTREEGCALQNFVYDCAELCEDGQKACFVVEDWTYYLDLLDMNVCACCGKHNNVPAHKFLSCSKCKIVHYCSKACLRSNWQCHKNFCIGWKGQRVLPDSTCWMGPTAGKIKFANLDEANEFFAQKQKPLKVWTRLSQMKRATNDFLLDLFTSPSEYFLPDFLLSNPKPSDRYLIPANHVDSDHPKLYAARSGHPESLLKSQLEQVLQDEHNPGTANSPLNIAMHKHGLQGTVFIFLRTTPGPFQILVCKRSTLLDGVKKNRDWNKQKANEKQKQDESTEQYDRRRRKLCDNVMYWHELVKRLESPGVALGIEREAVMFAFATEKFPLMFFNLNADRLMPYGMFHHVTELSRYDLRVPRQRDWDDLLRGMDQDKVDYMLDQAAIEYHESAKYQEDILREQELEKEREAEQEAGARVFFFKGSADENGVAKRKPKSKRDYKQ